VSEAGVTACVALGSNLEDPAGQVSGAFAELAAIPATRLVARSRLYRTRAVGPPQPDYVNAAAVLQTTLEPGALLAALQRIEADHGRLRETRWGPRTLDLDLLTYGDRVIDTPVLRLPHPHLAERAFVLAPLAEVAADLRIPGLGTVRDLLSALTLDGVAAMGGDDGGR
jgi:2-amino-4-hydroxy-6-hydroxymethyldihydropteridine diphosphokinase